MTRWAKIWKHAHGPSLVEESIPRVPLVVLPHTHLLPRVGDVGLAVHGVVCPPVVLGVCVLPGEVWDQQRLVHDEAPEVVECLTVGECPVAALMGQDPVPGEDAPPPQKA